LLHVFSAGDLKNPKSPHACATAVRQEIAMSFEGQDVVVEVASTQSCNNERLRGFNKLEEHGGKRHFFWKTRKMSCLLVLSSS
jgi:hypothetical protein